VRVLRPDEWRERERAYFARVDAATEAHRARRRDAVKHPVEDFLFTYYANSVTALRRWHPGAGVALAGGTTSDRADWRYYRGDRVERIGHLLKATWARPAQFGCFGLHEWAMVYRLDHTGVRHPDWPLRLGPRGTDAVVESHTLTCSHVDAFRFFTPSSRPRNSLQPTRDRQVALEQPGCLHAGMDCYKWAYQLLPLVSSELEMDCFDLARDIRVLDMRASPYDLSDLGYEPVPIETREGKAAYVEAQRGFSSRSQALRRRLLDILASLPLRLSV
jgi:hypothetical protein